MKIEIDKYCEKNNCLITDKNVRISKGDRMVVYRNKITELLKNYSIE